MLFYCLGYIIIDRGLIIQYVLMRIKDLNIVVDRSIDALNLAVALDAHSPSCATGRPICTAERRLLVLAFECKHATIRRGMPSLRGKSIPLKRNMWTEKGIHPWGSLKEKLPSLPVALAASVL
jgi:hypothetical protein